MNFLLIAFESSQGRVKAVHEENAGMFSWVPSLVLYVSYVVLFSEKITRRLVDVQYRSAVVVKY